MLFAVCQKCENRLHAGRHMFLRMCFHLYSTSNGASDPFVDVVVGGALFVLALGVFFLFCFVFISRPQQRNPRIDSRWSRVPFQLVAFRVCTRSHCRRPSSPVSSSSSSSWLQTKTHLQPQRARQYNAILSRTFDLQQPERGDYGKSDVAPYSISSTEFGFAKVRQS